MKRRVAMRDFALQLYAILLWLSALLSLVAAYRQRHAWVMGDWLIHYAGGFVRRGLFGQIFVALSRVTGLNPGVFAVLTILLNTKSPAVLAELFCGPGGT